jgi:hypothetical protein
MSRQDVRKRWAAALIVAVGAGGLIVVAGLMVLAVAGGGSEDRTTAADVQAQESGAMLPPYALEGRVAVAYQFALDRPDVMLWMPCYCGCGGHSGHRNARDCFINSSSSSGNVQFDNHGSECNVCVDIAVRAKELTLAGWALSDIRAAVDQEFGDIGPGTETPLPPE